MLHLKRTNDQRENSFKLLKTWDGMAFEGTFLGINDVRQDKTNPTPLWKLPSLGFTGSKLMGDTDFTLDWDTEYVNYYRENGVGGHRIDLFPRLSAPLPLGPYLESRVEAGVRDTLYNVQTYGDGTWDQSDTPNRLLGSFHTELGTTLLKDFGLNMGDTEGISHQIRPYIEYDYLSDENQDDLPVFDSTDRLGDENSITYGVDNFFNLFGNSGDETEYGYLKIKQSYDLRSEASDKPFSPVNVRLAWLPMKDLKVIYKTDIDVYDEGIIFYGLETYYHNSRGDFLNLDYRYDQSADIHQINVDARVQLFDTIFAAYDIEHSISESQVIEQNVSLMYQPACWSVELKSRYTPGDHTVMVVFNLANIGTPFGVRL